MKTITAKLTLISLLFCCPLANASAYIKPVAKQDQWQVDDAKSLGWNTAILDNMKLRIDQNEFKHMTSVLISHKGNLVYEEYFNEGHMDYLHDLRSATKSVTSTAVGLAIDQGHIDSVRQSMVSFFPEKLPVKNPTPKKDAITLEDLLTMSSALECNDDNPFSRGNEERMYIYYDWVKFALDLPIKGFAPWETIPEESPFGRSFAYCTAGSFMLGAIVEKSTGMSMASLLKTHIESSMGIKNSKWFYSPNGISNGSGGTRYRSRDFLKYGKLFLNKGKWNGKQLISEKWVEQATKSHVRVRKDVEYGYQWWRYRFEIEGVEYWSFAATGNGGNYLFVQPELGIVALITSRAYGQRYMHPQSQRLYKEFILASAPKDAVH